MKFKDALDLPHGRSRASSFRLYLFNASCRSQFRFVTCRYFICLITDAPEVWEERCNAATALATVNGNEIREQNHCHSDGKVRRVDQHFWPKSGDRPQ